MKKLKQHEERGEDYDSYIPVSVMKKQGGQQKDN
jgi:hypothetical protein